VQETRFELGFTGSKKITAIKMHKTLFTNISFIPSFVGWEEKEKIGKRLGAKNCISIEIIQNKNVWICFVYFQINRGIIT